MEEDMPDLAWGDGSRHNISQNLDADRLGSMHFIVLCPCQNNNIAIQKS